MPKGKVTWQDEEARQNAGFKYGMEHFFKPPPPPPQVGRPAGVPSKKRGRPPAAPPPISSAAATSTAPTAPDPPPVAEPTATTASAGAVPVPARGRHGLGRSVTCHSAGTVLPSKHPQRPAAGSIPAQADARRGLLHERALVHDQDLEEVRRVYCHCILLP